MVNKISLLSGHGRNGRAEAFGRIDMTMGQIVSIVGPTGSGKTTLINDVELFADRDTPTGRRVLINDEPVPAEFRYNPAVHPIAAHHATYDVPLRPAGARVSADALPRANRRRRVAAAGRAGDRFRQPTDRRADRPGQPHDGAFRRPDAGLADCRRHGDLQYACGAFGRSGERGHPSCAGRATAAGAPQNLRFCDARPAYRPALGLSHRDAGRLYHGRAVYQRGRACGFGPREPVGRRPFGPSREAPPRPAARHEELQEVA